MKKKKILFYHPLFLDGGAEKTNIIIAEKLAKDYEIIFVSNIFSSIFNDEIKRLKIKKINLKSNRTISSFFELSRVIQNQEPDLIFSIQMHANVLMLLINKIFFGKKLKIICCERLSSKSYYKNFKGYLILILAKFLYQDSKKIICNSKELCYEIFKLCKCENITYIYNPTLNKNYKKLSKQHTILDKPFLDNKKKIISIGRLDEVKNQLMLLRAVNLCKNKSNLNIIFVGQGKMKAELIEFSKKINFRSNLFFYNFKKNPFPYLLKSDLLVHTSNFEGMPNILIEAMALNKTIISTNCPTGPKEILLNGKAGFLITKNDHKNLAKKIDLLFDKPSVFLKQKTFYRKSLKRFNPKKILNKYKKIVDQIIEWRA